MERIVVADHAHIEWIGRYQIPKRWQDLREARRIALPGGMGKFRDDSFTLWDELLEALHP
jgi:hypothetical protein